MRTRFWKLSVLALALLLALSGCSLIEIDQEMDNAETVAEVGGVKITKGEVINDYNYQLNYTLYLYNAYTGVTSLTQEQKDSVKDSVLEAYIQTELMKQKAAELNLTDFSDESFAEADQKAADYFEELIEQHKEDVVTDSMTDEQAREATIAHLQEEGVTLDDVKKNYRDQHVNDLVRNYVIADIAVTDEELQAKYDEKVAADESSYASSNYLFELHNTYGYTITWMPEGYRTVKHILFKLTEEQTAALNDLNSQLASVTTSINTFGTEDTDETKDKVQEAENPSEPAPTLEELNAQKADLEQQIEAKKAEILSSFQEKTDDVYARLEAGESFDALMEELGEDTGMQSEPNKTTGYYVCEKSSLWDTNFRDAAMALEKVGDVSQPVLSSSGVHIIYYNSDVTPGAVDLETVRDALSEELLSDKQDEAYNAQYEEWKQAANAKKYPKVLN